MIIGFLAVVSASVAAGMRVALPLLIILLLYGEQLVANLPLVGLLPVRVLVAILITWSLVELVASKQLLGQRVLQVIQLIFAPLAGIVLSITAAQILGVEFRPLWLLGIVGGLIAFVFKLILTGWFFRLRGLPLWWSFTEDILCVILVLFAFRMPQQGGVLATIILWLAVRSATEWKRYYDEGRSPQKSKLDNIDGKESNEEPI